MENSILNDIKDLLPVQADDIGFNKDVMFHINTAFAILRQLGVGPKDGYRIKSDNNIWSEFLEEGPVLDMAKDYVYMKCKIIFDPPASSVMMDCLKENIKELESRLNYEVDPIVTEETPGGETDDEY